MTVRVDPGPARWVLPDPGGAPEGEDLVSVGGDLDPGTVLAGYRSGLFPMFVRPGVLGWWSPDPRAYLPLDGLRISRSLRKSIRHFDVTVDRAFEAVMRACADPSRPDGWITEHFVETYTRLHTQGWAHSVEVWRAGELVGGLYGVEIGGLFAGESMFHRERDASKVALVNLVAILAGDGQPRLLDVQWRTRHLASLGVVEVPRPRYLAMLPAALALPPVL